MHITVYLGANCGTDPHLAQAVRELGAWIGPRLPSGNASISVAFNGCTDAFITKLS